jgi:hypothetical protein
VPTLDRQKHDSTGKGVGPPRRHGHFHACGCPEGMRSYHRNERPSVCSGRGPGYPYGWMRRPLLPFLPRSGTMRRFPGSFTHHASPSPCRKTRLQRQDTTFPDMAFRLHPSAFILRMSAPPPDRTSTPGVLQARIRPPRTANCKTLNGGSSRPANGHIRTSRTHPAALAGVLLRA